MTRRIALLASLLLVTVSSGGQQAQMQTAEKERNARSLKAFTQDGPSPGAERALEMYGVDAFPCEKETASEQVHNTCLQARQAYYDYYVRGLPRRTRVYEWNNFSTRVIFFVVLSLVAVGVYFSWKQFFGMAVKPSADRSEEPAKGKDEQSLMTEFEAGLGGIKVKSPVLGVILLTVSLAFFYLYLRYVYPVTTNF